MFLIVPEDKVFRVKGNLAQLKQIMQRVVTNEYSKSETHVCLEKLEDHIPASIASKLQAWLQVFHSQRRHVLDTLYLMCLDVTA